MDKQKDSVAINIFSKFLKHDSKNLKMPPPIFVAMQCEVLEYNEEEKTLTTKMPVLEQWLNPYGTMQGGMIDAAMDNAVGPLSLLVAPMNILVKICP